VCAGKVGNSILGQYKLNTRAFARIKAACKYVDEINYCFGIWKKGLKSISEQLISPKAKKHINSHPLLFYKRTQS